MAKIVAAANNKGGAGKTTTTVNLAASLAYPKRDYRVLLVDLDGQRSASRHLGVEDREAGQTAFQLLCGDGRPVEPIQLSPTLSIIPGHIMLNSADTLLSKMPATDRNNLLTRALKPYLERFDFIILDCPPALGMPTINALMAADCFYIPTNAEYLGLEGVITTINLANSLRGIRKRPDGAPRNLGIVFNETDRRVTLTDEIVTKVRTKFGELVFKNEIVKNVKFTEAPSHGKSIYQFSPKSPGRHSFDRFTLEFLARMALN